MFYHLTKKSNNAKTGPIPVSTTSSESCPESCPLKSLVCYAFTGWHLRMHWESVTKGIRGVPFAEFLSLITALPIGQLWRHNQAGDLPGVGQRIDRTKLRALTKANEGKFGFTYTHKPPTTANLAAIKEANEGGFTVNLSADSLDQADAYVALQVGPVVVTLPEDQRKPFRTPSGTYVAICPAVISDTVTCATCGMCAKRARSSVIGFPVHGNGRKKFAVA
jgi:hypothetical protein